MKEYDDKDKVEVVSLKQNSVVETKKKSLIAEYKNKLLNGRIFNIKGAKILLPLLIILILGVMLFDFNGTSDVKQTSNGDEDVGYTSSLKYIDAIERKLGDVLCAIQGVGKTQIMISIDSSPILTVATNNEEKTVSTSGGATTTSTSEPIIITSNGKSGPLVLGESLPEIKGVIVVSEGAKDIKVKLDIINAVRTVLGISSDKVDVFIGN